MPFSTRKLGWRRFITVIMSLVVVLASVVGMALHASADGHHSHLSSAAHQHDGDVHDGDLHHDEGSSCLGDVTHAKCGDLFCHGSWTAAPIGAVTVTFASAPVWFCWRSVALVEHGVSDLDRPPKPLVRA